MIVDHRLTHFVLLLTLAVMVTVFLLLYTMPKSALQPPCESLCLPSDPFFPGSEIRCACTSNRLKEYSTKAIMEEENSLNEGDEEKTMSGLSPHVKPSARVTGNKQSPLEEYDGNMTSMRDWHTNNGTAFLKYGMEYRYGRLVVPTTGVYLIHSFLSFYEVSKNMTPTDNVALEKRHIYNAPTSQSIKHAIFRFNILNSTEEELIRTEHPREVPQCGNINIYGSYLSAAVSLRPGDEVYVKISDLELLLDPSSNFFGVSML